MMLLPSFKYAEDAKNIYVFFFSWSAMKENPIRNQKLWLIKGSKTHSIPCGDFRSADHLQALIKPHGCNP
jgi:hypothetical protein